MKLYVLMDKIALDWLTKVSDVIGKFKTEVYTPESVFLIASSDLTYFLKEKLQRQGFDILLVDNINIRPPVAGVDLVFKLELMFLDNLYKI
jgi:hypothetical protein